MKFDVVLAGASGKQRRTVELERDGQGWRVSLDAQLTETDLVQIDAHTFSILLDGHSYTFQVTQPPNAAIKVQTPLQEFAAEVADPRAWRSRRQGLLQTEGRQQVVAPMPGKVIRLLVKVGDQVQAGQGLLVVEAMKMQNEIRAPKAGIVERLSAQEGQPVNAGEILCVVS